MTTRRLPARTAVLLALGLLIGLAGCQADGGPAATASAPAPAAPSTGPGNADTTPADAVVIDVRLENGTVEPNGTKIDVRAGQTVLINATSDHDDEVHVHSDPGLELTVPAGQTVHGSFVAQESGSFEVESHHPHKIIAILNVR